jgi:prevent-host-death family protein
MSIHMVPWYSVVARTYSITEARQDFASLVHEAESGGPVTLARRGKRVAVLLSREQYEELTQKKRGYWRALQDLRKAYDLGRCARGAGVEGLERPWLAPAL